MAYLNKAIIQAEVMSDAVLPALFVVSVIGEPVHDELVDLSKGQSEENGWLVLGIEKI